MSMLRDYQLALNTTDAKHRQILSDQEKNMHIILEEDIREHAPFNLFFEGLRTNNNVVSKPNKYVIQLLCHLSKKYFIPLCFVKIYHLNKNMCSVREKPFFQLVKTILQYQSDVRIDLKLIMPEDINDSKEILDAFKALYGDEPKLDVCSLNEQEFEQALLNKEKFD